jgi:hypothetical protein
MFNSYISQWQKIALIDWGQVKSSCSSGRSQSDIRKNLWSISCCPCLGSEWWHERVHTETHHVRFQSPWGNTSYHTWKTFTQAILVLLHHKQNEGSQSGRELFQLLDLPGCDMRLQLPLSSLEFVSLHKSPILPWTSFACWLLSSCSAVRCALVYFCHHPSHVILGMSFVCCQSLVTGLSLSESSSFLHLLTR